jgi:hypothetical protein
LESQPFDKEVNVIARTASANACDNPNSPRHGHDAGADPQHGGEATEYNSDGVRHRESWFFGNRASIERRMATNPPKGYSFVSCNRKKRKAKFVSPTGQLKFVTF